MRTILTLVAAWLLVGVVQTVPAQDVIQVDLDHAAFAYDTDHSLLEIYLAFGASSLPFVSGEDGFRADLPVAMKVLRSTEATLEGTPSEPVWQDSLTLSFVLPDTSNLGAGQFFIHQARLPVQPGEFELRVFVPEDIVWGRSSLEMRRDILVPDFAEEGSVGISDVTLATSIAPSQDREGPFYKNGLDIRPNANQIYGQGMSKLYYYAEAYQTGGIATAEGKYTVVAYVAEANKPQPLPGLQRRLSRDARDPDVLAGTFNVEALPSGSYFLRLAVLNEANEAITEQSRKFFVYNPSVAQAEPEPFEVTFETSPYAQMTQEEVDLGLKHISIVATDSERRRGRRIEDLEEQRRFLMDFWQKRDPDPSTAINEYRDQFYERLQYANERYSSAFQEGWDSDRGHVVIKYGVPGIVEPHLFDRDTVPHEIWQYNNIPGQGQALFVFYDEEGSGRFELLHSTVTGERTTLDWQAELRRNIN